MPILREHEKKLRRSYFYVAISSNCVNPVESVAYVGPQFVIELDYGQRKASLGDFVHTSLEKTAYCKRGDVDCMSAQVVVVTGASAGLGRAIAHAFAKSGARLGLIARNPEALEAAREEVIALGGEALMLPLDVSDSEAVDAAATKIEEAFGPIDVWVNNAMVSVFSPMKEMKAAEYKRVTEVTYLGYVHGTLSALHRMLPRNRGRIIQVGSALAVRSIPFNRPIAPASTRLSASPTRCAVN